MPPGGGTLHRAVNASPWPTVPLDTAARFGGSRSVSAAPANAACGWTAVADPAALPRHSGVIGAARWWARNAIVRLRGWQRIAVCQSFPAELVKAPCRPHLATSEQRRYIWQREVESVHVVMVHHFECLASGLRWVAVLASAFSTTKPARPILLQGQRLVG